MTYFVWKRRVQLILFTITLIESNTTEPHNQTDSNTITDFLQKFIKPFLRTTNFGISPLKNTAIIHEKESKIEKLIRKKVADLKPLLENDYDYEKQETEDNLTLRGNDETTVIEFLPQSRKSNNGNERIISKTLYKPDPLKADINKYKLLREQIEIALDKEQISQKTKSLILHTLDEMLAQLIESQCEWNRRSYSIDKRLLKAHNDTRDAIIKLHAMSKKQWKNLRHQYLQYLNHKRDKENAFINAFHDFFSNVINDTYNLPDKYKIKCELIETSKDESAQEKHSLRGSNSVSHCDRFKVCSDELHDFLLEFYNYVNDTAVSTFKNYAEMYVRDVNIDFGLDKNVVITIINSLGDNAEGKVNKIYKKAIKKFTLDSNKGKVANIRLITTFIKNVVSYVKSAVKENLIKELSAMKTKLFLTVKEDLVVNLEVDMENLERHYTETLCSMFLSCNGQSSSRKQGGPWTFRPKANKEVFVKVQLSLDDEMKDVVARSGLLKMFEKPGPYHMKFRQSRKLGHSEITRTTMTLEPTTVTIDLPTMTSTGDVYTTEKAKHIHHQKGSDTTIVDDQVTRLRSEANEANEIEKT